VEPYQLAWTLYVIGGLGSGLAAWLLFRRWGRAWGLIFMVTAWVLLLTPYALDAETMTMAPALFILVMDGAANGFETVKPIAVVLLGLWLVALIITLLLQLVFGRRKALESAQHLPADGLDEEERAAREDLLDTRETLHARR
jgi:hypothetical protein